MFVEYDRAAFSSSSTGTCDRMYIAILYYLTNFSLVTDLINALRNVIAIIVGVVIGVIVLIAKCIAIPIIICC